MRLLALLTASGLLLTCAVPVLIAQTAPAGPPFSAAVAAGDVLYLSGALPLDAAGKVVPGDIRVQTARTLDNLAAVLQRGGSRMEQVASVTVYLRNAADFAAMNEVYRKYWPKDPPARTTVIANLVMPEALVEIAMIALKDGVERQVVHPSGWLHSPNPYSYGIRSKNTLFLSGLVPRHGKDNTPVLGDMRTQTRAVLQNARDVLAAAGMTLDDVVASRVYLTDSALFQDMNAAYREAFTSTPPARATVRCGLTAADFLVEITLVAVKDPGRQAVGLAAGSSSPAPRPVLSPGIRVGDRLYLSGMLGNTPAAGAAPEAQTSETMARIGRTLEAAGFAWSDVVDSTVYLANLQGFQAMNAAYRGALGPALPARATIEAGLMAPDGLVEIMMTAVKGEKRYIR